MLRKTPVRALNFILLSLFLPAIALAESIPLEPTVPVPGDPMAATCQDAKTFRPPYIKYTDDDARPKAEAAGLMCSAFEARHSLRGLIEDNCVLCCKDSVLKSIASSPVYAPGKFDYAALTKVCSDKCTYCNDPFEKRRNFAVPRQSYACPKPECMKDVPGVAPAEPACFDPDLHEFCENREYRTSKGDAERKNDYLRQVNTLIVFANEYFKAPSAPTAPAAPAAPPTGGFGAPPVRNGKCCRGSVNFGNGPLCIPPDKDCEIDFSRNTPATPKACTLGATEEVNKCGS